jgi:hypothetical protein
VLSGELAAISTATATAAPSPASGRRPRLDFAAPLVAGRAGGAVGALVAHEASHAYVHATRLPHRDEALADKLLREWGFLPEALPGRGG